MPFCRLCLSQCTENLPNIFQCVIKNSDEEGALTNVLFWTFGVEVDASDSYTKAICSHCISFVEQILKYRKKFQLNQELLKNGPSEIELPVNDKNDSRQIDHESEIKNNTVEVSCSDLDVICAQPTIIVRQLEQTYTYQTYKKVGPRQFRKRKRPKLELDDSVVNDICKSLEASNFGDLSSPHTRSVGVNTSGKILGSKQCDKCDLSNQNPSQVSEDNMGDHDSGVENDDVFRDILQKSLVFERKGDFLDWTQISFKKDVSIGTEAIFKKSIAVSTQDLLSPDKSPTELDLDDFKKFKLKLKSTSSNSCYSDNIGDNSEKAFDTFVGKIKKETICELVEAEEEDLFKEFLKSLTKTYNTTGTITDFKYSEVSSQKLTNTVGTLTRQRTISKIAKQKIIDDFLKKSRFRSKTVGTLTDPLTDEISKETQQIIINRFLKESSSHSMSVGTLTDPLSDDKVLVDMNDLDKFSPVVEIIPLEYTIDEDYEQMTDITFVLRDQTYTELLKERQKRFIDYYYGFSSFGIRELVTGTTFREKEKENTNMSVCHVSSICDIYICNLCSRQFTRETALKTHSLVHKNEDFDTEVSEERNTRKKKRRYKKVVSQITKKNSTVLSRIQKRKGKNTVRSQIEKRSVQNKSSELFQMSNFVEGAVKLQERSRPTNEDLKYTKMKMQLSENNVELVFSCTKCDFSCRDENVLSAHRITSHSFDEHLTWTSDKASDNVELEFACNKCDYHFENRRLLLRHQAKTHGIVSHSLIKTESASSESETELVDVENSEQRWRSNVNKNNETPKYVWDSKKFGKYSALTASKQKQNLLNSSDESSSPKCTPTKKNVRDYSSIEDDLETVRNLQKKLKISRRGSILDCTVSKLATRLDNDAS